VGLGGDDRLYGQNDRLEESHGGEKYLVGDRLAGGPGDDLLDGGVDDRLLGSSGPDMLTGADGGADRVRGDAGNDHVEAGGGADDLRGGPGADWIADFGWHCADTIHGGPWRRLGHQPPIRVHRRVQPRRPRP
jgi:Ca2+-binding RTX toxin-like protein